MLKKDSAQYGKERQGALDCTPFFLPSALVLTLSSALTVQAAESLMESQRGRISAAPQTRGSLPSILSPSTAVLVAVPLSGPSY